MRWVVLYCSKRQLVAVFSFVDTYKRSRFWLAVSTAPRAKRGPRNKISAGPRSMGRTLSPTWDWQRTDGEPAWVFLEAIAI